MDGVTETNKGEPELQEPPLRITVAGMRWYGDEWKVEGDGATIDFHGTDGTDGPAELLSVLRALTVKRVQALLTVLALTWDGLDWDRPDSPIESDLDQLVAQVDGVSEAIYVLRELAPQLIEPEENSPDA